MSADKFLGQPDFDRSAIRAVSSSPAVLTQGEIKPRFSATGQRSTGTPRKPRQWKRRDKDGERRILYPEKLPELFTCRVDRLERILVFVDWLGRMMLVAKGRQAYVYVTSSKLRKLLGGSYKEVINPLLAAKFIETDGKWRVGGKAIGYRIADSHPLGNLASMTVKGHSERVGRLSGSVGLSPHREILKAVMSASISDSTPPPDLSYGKLLNWHYSVDDITNRNYFYSVGEVTGRVFHNVTSMKRELRARLILDGESTSEIDLANAQPYLLALLYPEGTGEERDRYKERVTAGKFYEFFTERGPIKDRDVLKTRLFSNALFAKANYRTTTALWKLFETGFPILAREVERITPAKLPNVLQRMEAAVFIDLIAPALHRAGITSIPVHDAVIVPASQVDRAVKIIASILTKETGMVPRLKVKTFA